MIKEKDYKVFVEKYKKQEKEIAKKMELIISGKTFGFYNYYCDEFWPCKYVETIDKKDGFIKIIPPDNIPVSEYVVNLKVKDYDLSENCM